MLLNGAPDDATDGPPILTGLNRALSSQPLIDAHRLAHYLADINPDLVIAPFAGGIAQGVLAARGCGEAFARTRVALWYDGPSRTRFLLDDELLTGMAPLVADGLERQSITLADALLVRTNGSPALPGWVTSAAPPTFEVALPGPLATGDAPQSAGREIREIVFAGPIRKSAGIHEFIAATERLAAKGLLAGRTIVFLGVVRSSGSGISREWLGRRAGAWPFAFKVIEEQDAGAVRRYLADRGRLAVSIGHDNDQLDFIRSCGSNHLGFLGPSEDAATFIDHLEATLRDTLVHRALPSQEPKPAVADWRKLAKRLRRLPVRPIHESAPGKRGASPLIRRLARLTGHVGITVCVLHHNRLAELASALATIPDSADGHSVEVIVIDNASDNPSVEEEIRARAPECPRLRIIRLTEPMPQTAAFNRGLSEARGDIVFFLDDDNAYLPGGLARLARAVDQGRFDIAVTALEIFEGDQPAADPTVGRLIFMGEAHSAGLFFNAFGDTSMAVRRDVFTNFGGFHNRGYDYPALDWVTLAKAQAAGLRIGALQWPAVRYRRDSGRAELATKKLDQEGARALVFEAYRGALDGELLARYAQKLQLEEP